MNHSTTIISALEDLPAYPGVDHQVLSLCFERPNARVETLEFGGAKLHVERFQSRIWFREFQTGDTVFFGLIIPLGDAVRFGAHEVATPTLVSWVGIEGQETDYVIEAGTLNYMVEVPLALARERGWLMPPARITQLPKKSAERFASVCELSLKLSVSGAQCIANFDTVLNALDVATENGLYKLQSSVVGRRALNKHKRIVTAALEHLVEANPTESDAEPEIWRELGISRRTYFSAFHSQLGIGPSKLRNLLRLRELRTRLLSSDVETVSVASLMHDVGFTQLGRTSGLYRLHYGELPVETLRRTPPN